MSERLVADFDRGALAAFELLERGWNTHDGEDSYEDTAKDIRAAIEADGLAVVIRRQMDYEADFLDEDDLPDPFPDSLRTWASKEKTVWK